MWSSQQVFEYMRFKSLKNLNLNKKDKKKMTSLPNHHSQEFNCQAQPEQQQDYQQQNMAGIQSTVTPASGLPFQSSKEAGAFSAQQLSVQQEGVHQQAGDDFYLLDVVGGSCSSVMHPTKPIVAYTSGCMIIVFDLMSDAKIQLVNHQHEVHALAFSPVGAGNSPTGGDYLISVDFNRNEGSDDESISTMCLWNWSKGLCLQELRIPQSQSSAFMVNAQPSLASRENMRTRAFHIQFDRTGQMFVVVESSVPEVGGGYRASVWSFSRHQSIDLVSHNDLELASSCLGMQMLHKTSTGAQQLRTRATNPTSHTAHVFLNTQIQFLTIEKSCIKIWEFFQGNFELIKRIHIKQNIRQCVISEMTDFMLILGENGKLLILDNTGEFVSTVSADNVFFTTIGTANDKLLLGTEKGTIHVYHMASLHFVSEIPYQMALLSSNALNSTKQRADPLEQPQSATQEALLRVGPPVHSIQSTQNLRFLKIKYRDSSFVIVDRTCSNPSQAIMGYQFGHFEEVTGLQWMGRQQKRNLISDQYQLVQQANECFVTCSSDLSVYVWRHFGDRWQFSYIDVAKCFDASLSYQRKACDKSTRDLKLTSITMFPRRQNLVVGDNKGTVRIFQLGTDSATLLSTYKLQRSPELSEENSNGLSISSIYLTNNEQIAIISFQSGLISCYDVKASFQWIGDIEKDAHRFTYQNLVSGEAKVLEKTLEEEVQALGGVGSPGASERILSPQNHSTQFRVFSIKAPNCVRLQLVEIKDNRMTQSSLVQFFVNDGKVTGFDIHPSKDYLLVTTSKGKIYIFRIDTGELRGTINIPLHARGCQIDPSGLYVVVQVPPFSPRHTANLNNQAEDFGSLGTNERDLSRTTILMYEIGTGLAAAEVLSIFDISQMSFSSDGRFLALGSQRGAVSVWALGDHLYKNAQQILEAMQNQPDFWYNYPIYGPDYAGNRDVRPAQIEAPALVHNVPGTSHYLHHSSAEKDLSQHQSKLSRQPFAPQQASNTISYRGDQIQSHLDAPRGVDHPSQQKTSNILSGRPPMMQQDNQVHAGGYDLSAQRSSNHVQSYNLTNQAINNSSKRIGMSAEGTDHFLSRGPQQLSYDEVQHQHQNQGQLHSSQHDLSRPQEVNHMLRDNTTGSASRRTGADLSSPNRAQLLYSRDYHKNEQRFQRLTPQQPVQEQQLSRGLHENDLTQDNYLHPVRNVSHMEERRFHNHVVEQPLIQGATNEPQAYEEYVPGTQQIVKEEVTNAIQEVPEYQPVYDNQVHTRPGQELQQQTIRSDFMDRSLNERQNLSGEENLPKQIHVNHEAHTPIQEVVEGPINPVTPLPAVTNPFLTVNERQFTSVDQIEPASRAKPEIKQISPDNGFARLYQGGQNFTANLDQSTAAYRSPTFDSRPVQPLLTQKNLVEEPADIDDDVAAPTSGPGAQAAANWLISRSIRVPQTQSLRQGEPAQLQYDESHKKVYTLKQMRAAEEREFGGSFGTEKVQMKKTRDIFHIRGDQQALPDHDEEPSSHCESVDEAYAAINEFEARQKQKRLFGHMADQYYKPPFQGRPGFVSGVSATGARVPTRVRF